jgi:photosystem II stability/assembly factor-like uncharacterized protein
VFVRQERNRIVMLDAANVRGFRFDSAGVLYLITRENGVWRSADQGDTWTPTGLTRGGPADFTIDPNAPAVQYAAVGGAVQKSSDTGASWQIIYAAPRAGEAITAIAVDPRSDSHIIAATSAGSLLSSLDSGKTWRVVSFQTAGYTQLIVHPQTAQILYAITSGGPIKSIDGGLTWKSLSESLATFPGGNQFNSLALLPGSPDTLFAATNAGVLTSPDGGTSWTSVPNLVPLGTTVTLTVVRDSRTFLVVTNNRLLKTTDGARTWRTLTAPTGRALSALAFDPTKSDTVYLGTLKVKR